LIASDPYLRSALRVRVGKERFIPLPVVPLGYSWYWVFQRPKVFQGKRRKWLTHHIAPKALFKVVIYAKFLARLHELYRELNYSDWSDLVGYLRSILKYFTFPIRFLKRRNFRRINRKRNLPEIQRPPQKSRSVVFHQPEVKTPVLEVKEEPKMVPPVMGFYEFQKLTTVEQVMSVQAIDNSFEFQGVRYYVTDPRDFIRFRQTTARRRARKISSLLFPEWWAKNRDKYPP